MNALAEINTLPEFEITTLETIRRRKGISQLRLARMINRQQTHISKWENGLDEPKPGDLRNIARVLNWEGDPKDLIRPWVDVREAA